jgi:predicted DNA-binding WGR domain protein
MPNDPAIDLIPTHNTITSGDARMKKRYFEFVGGTSAKFWEIGVSGTAVTVRFGRIGTEGQTQVKELADADAAAKHAEKLIGQKLAKGYRETVAC